jgi:hypothetical protein
MSYLDLMSFKAEAKTAIIPAKDAFLRSLTADKASKMTAAQNSAAQAYIASTYTNDPAMNRAMDLLIEAAGDLVQQAKIDNEHAPRRGYRAPINAETRAMAADLLPR